MQAMYSPVFGAKTRYTPETFTTVGSLASFFQGTFSDTSSRGCNDVQYILVRYALIGDTK